MVCTESNPLQRLVSSPDPRFDGLVLTASKNEGYSNNPEVREGYYVGLYDKPSDITTYLLTQKKSSTCCFILPTYEFHVSGNTYSYFVPDGVLNIYTYLGFINCSLKVFQMLTIRRLNKSTCNSRPRRPF